MDSILFACLAGASFGAGSVAVLRGLHKAPDVEAGSFVTVAIALPITAVAAVAFGGGRDDLQARELWPFLVIGAVIPGTAAILFTRAVRDAGASRVVILLGAAPLVSVLIAIAVLDEPLRPGLAAGTTLIVAGVIECLIEPARCHGISFLKRACRVFCQMRHPGHERAFEHALPVQTTLGSDLRLRAQDLCATASPR